MTTTWAYWLIAIFLTFLGLEVWSIQGQRPTLSRTVLDWTQKRPIIAFGFGFLFGILGGHWFWSLC